MTAYAQNKFISDLNIIYSFPKEAQLDALSEIVKKINRSYSFAQFIDDISHWRWKEAHEQFNQLLIKKSVVALMLKTYKSRKEFGDWEHHKLEWRRFDGSECPWGKKHEEDLIRFAGIVKNQWRTILRDGVLLFLPFYGVAGAIQGALAVTAAYKAWTLVHVFYLDVHKYTVPE